MEKQKNRKIRIIKGLVIFVVCILFCVWGMQKTKWTEWGGSYTNLDGLSEFEEPNYEQTYKIKKEREYRIEAKGTISQGQITISFYLNDELLDEETFQSGDYEYKSIEISGTDGELIMHVSVVDGTTGVAYETEYVRCRNWYKLYQKIYGLFFEVTEER